MLTIFALVFNSRPTNEPVELDPGIITLLSNIVRAFRSWRQRTRDPNADGSGQRHRRTRVALSSPHHPGVNR